MSHEEEPTEEATSSVRDEREEYEAPRVTSRRELQDVVLWTWTG